MRRILLTTWGSYGDLFPYLALAIRLKQDGHVPVIATCEFYREMVTSAGIEFHPLSPDVDPEDTALIARVMDPAKGSEVIVRELIAPHVREAFEQVRTAAGEADLIISHPITFATPLAARAMNRRWLSGVLAPASMFSLSDFPLFPPFVGLLKLVRMSRWSASAFTALGRHVTAAWVQPVTSLAAALNIVDAGHPLYEGQFSPHGTLAMFSPVLGPPQPDWPPHAVATGFVFHQEGHALDARLQGFLDAGPPPIVFTLGSSAVGAPGRFWHESLDAIAALRQRAVLLVGRHEAAPTLPPSSDVFVTDYAPHAPLFAAASAIVHHGGVGTTGQAMRAGKPMLVVPHAHDQPDNAFRVRRLGLARVLDAGRYRAPAVAGHLRRLAMDDGYRIRSAEVGRVVDAERGADRACAVMLAACR